jgi:hypothetical protein
MQYGQQKKLWRTWRWKRGGKIMNLTWALEELRKTIGCDEEQDCCRECKECKWHQSSETMVKAIKIAVEALSGMEGQDETNTRREKDMEKKENKTEDKTALGLASPVAIYANKLALFFSGDPGVRVVADLDSGGPNYTIRLYVDNPAKCFALQKLMHHNIYWGNMSVSLEFTPGNTNADSLAELCKSAFEGNRQVATVEEFSPLPLQNKTCVEFAPNVGFYYADDIGRPDGYQATLMETLAADLFKADPGITFCTKRR